MCRKRAFWFSIFCTERNVDCNTENGEFVELSFVLQLVMLHYHVNTVYSEQNIDNLGLTKFLNSCEILFLRAVVANGTSTSYLELCSCAISQHYDILVVIPNTDIAISSVTL